MPFYLFNKGSADEAFPMGAAGWAVAVPKRLTDASTTEFTGRIERIFYYRQFCPLGSERVIGCLGVGGWFLVDVLMVAASTVNPVYFCSRRWYPFLSLK